MSFARFDHRIGNLAPHQATAFFGTQDQTLSASLQALSKPTRHWTAIFDDDRSQSIADRT
jgi:hypothetical protein